MTAQDGLTLHVRRYDSRHASAHLVVCLPGLGRTAADFHPLATALAADPANPRLVLALDYRGHGQSQYDRNPKNYTIRFALADLSAVMAALEITSALFVGTSFGGVLAMMLAGLPAGGLASGSKCRRCDRHPIRVSERRIPSSIEGGRRPGARQRGMSERGCARRRCGRCGADLRGRGAAHGGQATRHHPSASDVDYFTHRLAQSTRTSARARLTRPRRSASCSPSRSEMRRASTTVSGRSNR
jgi:alpha/beta hydrolase fold